MQQAWSEDTQTVFHEWFCRSTNIAVQYWIGRRIKYMVQNWKITKKWRYLQDAKSLMHAPSFNATWVLPTSELRFWTVCITIIYPSTTPPPPPALFTLLSFHPAASSSGSMHCQNVATTSWKMFAGTCRQVWTALCQTEMLLTYIYLSKVPRKRPNWVKVYCTLFVWCKLERRATVVLLKWQSILFS